MAYADVGRKLVLGLKHGDRLDYLPAMSRWMVASGKDLFQDDPLLVSVPLHRWRLFRRKYNQAAELTKSMGRITGHEVCLDALVRAQQTPKLDGKSREERFQILQDVIKPKAERSKQIQSRSIVLFDDVMTSGATLAACTEACKKAGAETVSVLVLARVAKDT